MAEELARVTGLGGSLRFFGDWFGGPRDNVHILTNIEVEDDTLVLRFDAGECLRIWHPRGLELRRSHEYPHPSLVIAAASRVRWESYYYGRPQTPENLRFIDYTIGAGRVERTTNWEAQLQAQSTEDSSRPAVELY
jgi:hypothetical protein